MSPETRHLSSKCSSPSSVWSATPCQGDLIFINLKNDHSNLGYFFSFLFPFSSPPLQSGHAHPSKFTRLNSRASSAASRSCVEARVGKTGVTCAAAFSYIQRERPGIVGIENVKNLAAAQPNGGPTNLETVVKRLNNMGYVVLARILSAQKYGFPQSRDRWWILGFLTSAEGIDQSQKGFVLPPFVIEVQSILQQLEVEMLPLSSFLRYTGVCPWIAEFESRGGKDPLTKKAKSGGAVKDQYTVSTLQEYENQGFAWPPNCNAEFQFYTRHLGDRQRQSIWFWERMLEKHAGDFHGSVASVDVNMSCEWQHVQKDLVPCLVSTSRTWLIRQMRLMSGMEALNLQGFSYQFQQVCDPPLTCREQVDLAGNAFNGGVCEAVLFALVVGSDWKTIVGHMLSARARRMAKMKESTAMQDEGEDEDSIDNEEQLESEQEVSRSEAFDFESDCADLD